MVNYKYTMKKYSIFKRRSVDKYGSEIGYIIVEGKHPSRWVTGTKTLDELAESMLYIAGNSDLATNNKNLLGAVTNSNIVGFKYTRPKSVPEREISKDISDRTIKLYFNEDLSDQECQVLDKKLLGLCEKEDSF